MKKNQRFWTTISGALLATISAFWGCIDCMFFLILFVFLLDTVAKERRNT